MLQLLSALCLCAAPALQDATPGAPAELLGSWRADGEAAELIRFEPQRCTRRLGEELSFFRASYGEGRVELERWLRLQVLELELEGERLLLREPGATEARVFRRLEGVPEELVLADYPVAEGAALEPAELARIQGELEARVERDQAIRQPGFEPEGDGELREVMGRESQENSDWMVELIGRVGWIDTARFGEEAADAAFLLVQHSPDLALQQTALPLVAAEVQAGVADAQNYALLYDRLELNLGRKQLYGTQLGQTPDGALALMPIADPAGVHARRGELGMISLGTYLGLFGQAVQLPAGVELPADG